MNRLTEKSEEDDILPEDNESGCCSNTPIPVYLTRDPNLHLLGPRSIRTLY